MVGCQFRAASRECAATAMGTRITMGAVKVPFERQRRVAASLLTRSRMLEFRWLPLFSNRLSNASEG